MSEEELIDDQYQFVMSIASGSSSQVLEVVEKNSGRHLAMKLLKKDVPEFKENKAQLKREADILKNLDHPLIVKFEKYSSNRDHTYMLMEHFRASNLKLQIKADTNKVHMRVRQLFEGVCAALAHVHQKGFIHRDIKPDNVLMNKAGEVRLCDFSLSSKQATGIGKMLAGKLKTIQGTRTYIAPETIRKRQPTFQTDLYSLGILFFEVLTCKTPFQAPTPEELLQKHLTTEPPNASEFNPNVSTEMDRLIAKLLKKKPVDRPASTDEVLAELRRIRIFKEDIVDEAAAKKANEDANALAMISEVRLDSRADAKLKEMIETNPEFAKKFQAEMDEKAKKKKVAAQRQADRIKAQEALDASKGKGKEKAAAPAPIAAAQPQIVQVPVPVPMPMPMPMPGYQGYPPGYPYPQPQMPMMQMPPGMGAPMPGMPQYPPQPQMAYPQQAPPVQQAPPMPQAQPTLQASPAPQAPPARPQSVEPPVRQMNAAEPPVRQTAPSKPQNPAAPPAKPAQPGAQATAPRPQPAKPASPAPAASGRPAAAAAKPAAPKPAVGAPGGPAARPSPPPQPTTGGDLDFMTELPDVL